MTDWKKCNFISNEVYFKIITQLEQIWSNMLCICILTDRRVNFRLLKHIKTKKRFFFVRRIWSDKHNFLILFDSICCRSSVVLQRGAHLVELTDVVQSCIGLRSLHLLHYGRHLVQLHWKLPLALGPLTHPLLHDLHQMKLRVQQPQDGCMRLWTPKILPKSHLWPDLDRLSSSLWFCCETSSSRVESWKQLLCWTNVSVCFTSFWAKRAQQFMWAELPHICLNLVLLSIYSIQLQHTDPLSPYLWLCVSNTANLWCLSINI